MKAVIEMQKKPDKECKHCIVFVAKDPEAVVRSLYVSKKFTDGSVPLKLTIET